MLFVANEIFVENRYYTWCQGLKKNIPNCEVGLVSPALPLPNCCEVGWVEVGYAYELLTKDILGRLYYICKRFCDIELEACCV